MNKVIVFFILIGIFVATFYFTSEINPIFTMENVVDACVVSDRAISVENIKNGQKYYNYCKYDEVKDLLQHNQCDALQLSFDKRNEKEIKKQCKFQEISRQKLGDIEILYGYTPFWHDCKYVDGKKVNMQIAIYDAKVIAGFPLLLTGY